MEVRRSTEGVSESEVQVNSHFSSLIAPIQVRMFDTVWRVLRHAQDAEDALQAALTTIWQQRARIERHPAPQPLMLRICADAAIDQYRRKKTTSREREILDDGVPSRQSLPVEIAIRNETLEIVVEAISRLSPNQATAVTMRFIQGESNAAIAAALECSTETVREHLERGKERLGRMLGRLGGSLDTVNTESSS